MGLLDVLQRWAAECNPRSKTVSEWTGIIKDFTKTTGRRPVAAIQKTHIVTYKDALAEAKKAPATIRTRPAALHTLLRYAAENEIIAQNFGKRHARAVLTAEQASDLVPSIRARGVDLVDARAGGFRGADRAVEASEQLMD